MSDGKRFQKWTPWMIGKLRLTGKPLGDDPKQRPAMFMKLVNNNPRIAVYLNDGSKGPVSLALDPAIAMQVMDTVIAIADSKITEDRITFDIRHSWFKGQKQDKPTIIGQVMVGRNSEGTVYIACREKGGPVAIFEFGASYWAGHGDAAGEALNKKLSSEIAARGWAELYKGMLTTAMITMTEEPKQKPGSGGNNNGGNNNSGGGNRGGGNNDDWENDLNF